jgi:hypothetical protein
MITLKKEPKSTPEDIETRLKLKAKLMEELFFSEESATSFVNKYNAKQAKGILDSLKGLKFYQRDGISFAEKMTIFLKKLSSIRKENHHD